MVAADEVTVDEFVKVRVLPEYRPIVELLRKQMRESAPKAKEAVGYGIPVYRGNKTPAVISPTKRGITLAFSRGAEFQDRYLLLTGVGRVSKNVRIASLEEVNKEALRYYIKEAVALDARPRRAVAGTRSASEDRDALRT